MCSRLFVVRECVCMFYFGFVFFIVVVFVLFYPNQRHTCAAFTCYVHAVWLINFKKYTEKPKRQPTHTHTHTANNQAYTHTSVHHSNTSKSCCCWCTLNIFSSSCNIYALSLSLLLYSAFHFVTPFGRVRCALCYEFSLCVCVLHIPEQ